MGNAIALTYEIQDAKGKSSRAKMHIPTDLSIDDISTFAVAMGDLVAALEVGVITEIGVSIELTTLMTFTRVVAHGLSDVFERMLTVGRSAASEVMKWILPTYSEVLTVSGSDQVDTDDSDVAAYLAILTDGVDVDGELVRPLSLGSDYVSYLTEQREIFRATR